MSKPNDGGSAFPLVEKAGSNHHNIPGMTLRDWFAGKTLQGILGNNNILAQLKGFDEKEAAHLAYEMADAMLEERNKS